MRSHEKRVNVCPRTQGKYLVSVVLTAVFAIASLFGTLLSLQIRLPMLPNLRRSRKWAT